MTRQLIVHTLHDAEAGVWVATSDDIPGLVTEAATYERLVERVLGLTPELLRDNAHLVEPFNMHHVKVMFKTVYDLDSHAA